MNNFFYRLTDHAETELSRRKIPVLLLEMVLDEPQQILFEREGRKAYQSIIEIADGKQAVLRAIVEEGDPIVVITVYYTTQVSKYWRP